jgi:hypothetical protein
MKVFLIIFSVLIFIVANALILLKTAKKPKIPKSVKSQPYDDENSGW